MTAGGTGNDAFFHIRFSLDPGMIGEFNDRE